MNFHTDHYFVQTAAYSPFFYLLVFLFFLGNPFRTCFQSDIVYLEFTRLLLAE